VLLRVLLRVLLLLLLLSLLLPLLLPLLLLVLRLAAGSVRLGDAGCWPFDAAFFPASGRIHTSVTRMTPPPRTIEI
jgi:hypothetical protein